MIERGNISKILCAYVFTMAWPWSLKGVVRLIAYLGLRPCVARTLLAAQPVTQCGGLCFTFLSNVAVMARRTMYESTFPIFPYLHHTICSCLKRSMRTWGVVFSLLACGVVRYTHRYTVRQSVRGHLWFAFLSCMHNRCVSFVRDARKFRPVLLLDSRTRTSLGVPCRVVLNDIFYASCSNGSRGA